MNDSVTDDQWSGGCRICSVGRNDSEPSLCRCPEEILDWHSNRHVTSYSCHVTTALSNGYEIITGITKQLYLQIIYVLYYYY